MSEEMDRRILRDVTAAGLIQLGLDGKVPADTADRLAAYSSLLLEKNRVMDLTAITDPKDVAALHLLDSLSLVPLLWPGAGHLVDVGTGAGLPGVPLAAALPACRVTLLDSLGKRISFLEEVSSSLELSNVSCVHARAEEFALEHREGFDWAVSRAVAALPVLCELCLPLVRPGGLFLAMKSVGTDREIASAASAIRTLGGQLEQVVDYTVPATDVVHRIVAVRKVSPAPGRYPRRFAQIKKRPL